MAQGDHIYVPFVVGGLTFQHHGIDMGDGTVVHLAPAEGARITIRDEHGEFSVRRDSLADFCRGETPRVVRHESTLEPQVIVETALRHIGQRGYSLMEGNCEHFATMCATGRSESHQIEMGQATVSAVASLATKAVWSVSSKAATRMAVRGVAKVHPAAMLADGVEIAALAIGCRQGLTAQQSKQVARISSSLAAAGIGGLVAGPAGAAVFLATHASSSAVADRICRSLRGLLS
ncbi:MAG: lecithin retinol acyltransferase family protein [bacterium]|nr:lecithin retinol acyltransferase family protein [bacterium]